eukprot:3692814-Pleurochrysis_carterae.AAC.1
MALTETGNLGITPNIASRPVMCKLTSRANCPYRTAPSGCQAARQSAPQPPRWEDRHIPRPLNRER